MSVQRFVHFLDQYQTKKDLQYNEYLVMLERIRHEYARTQAPVHLSVTPDHPASYYSLYSNSIWNHTNTDYSNSVHQSIHIDPNAYSLWKKTHEADLSFQFIPIQKEQVHIDASINNISDILRIIGEHPYQDNLEYNIDVKSLHNIKDELTRLDAMIGMETMKRSIVDQLLYFLQDLHIGNNVSEFKHTVIYGPPGTGKTEIAKIIGTMYSKLGVLKKNVFRKVTRSDLVAGYLGQTAIKTKKVIEECLGGVLFIDEAYSLANGHDQDSYSKECLDILCESLSDHKEDLMVIIAGYEEELNNTFFRVNKGLESRFIWRFKMDEYSPKEMMKIFKKQVVESGWTFESEDVLQERWFSEKKEEFKYFGRDMELLFTYTKICHSRRIYGKDKEVRKKISLCDINEGYQVFMKNKKRKEENHFMHSIYV